MAKINNPKNLQKGDIILYAGTNWISRIINFFDESKYSHASIYLGDDKIMESSFSGGGCKVNNLHTSAKDYDRLLLKRHANADKLDMNKVVAHALKFKDSRYDVAQIIQLAMIGINRKLSRYDRWVAKLLIKILEVAIDGSIAMHANDDNKTVCSEFVYRCYHDIIKQNNFDEYEIEVGMTVTMLDGQKFKKPVQRFVDEGSLIDRFYPNVNFNPDHSFMQRLNALDLSDFQKSKIITSEDFTEINFDYLDQAGTLFPKVNFQISPDTEKELNELMDEVEKTENQNKSVDSKVSDKMTAELKEKLDNFMILNSPQNRINLKNGIKSNDKSVLKNIYILHRQHFVTTKDLRKATNLIDLPN